MNHLYRSNDNKIVAGIIGGLGEYFKVDPNLLRVIFVVLMLITGVIPVLLAYFICIFIIPKKPISNIRDADFTESSSN